MPETGSDGLTTEQRAALAKISTARANNLFVLIDLIADMDHEGLSFLRRIGDKEDDGSTPLKDFLTKAHASTFKFLANAREDEIVLLEKGIRIVNAVGIIGSAIKWCSIAFIAMLAATSALGDWFVRFWPKK